MSLLSSMNIGATGLQSAAAELSVVGDNISNANTVGYKAQRVNFQDAIADTLIGGAGPSQFPLGVQVQSIQRLLSQGSLTQTGISTDMAIQGSGFFVLDGQHNGVNQQYYTRAGQFTIDSGGRLVNPEGLRVQGYPADIVGNLSYVVGDLNVGKPTSAPNATTSIEIKANLKYNSTTPAAWDSTDPSTTSNFSTGLNIYDSVGVAHAVNVYFRQTSSGAWTWHALTDGAGITAGTSGVNFEIASGTLAFSTSGKLTTVTQAADFDPINAVQNQALTFTFGDPTAIAGNTGLAGCTSFATQSAASFLDQDGFAPGDLSSLAVNQAGVVRGSFTNGQSRVLGQIAVANFEAPEKLQMMGGNLYGQAPNSGIPIIGQPGQGNRGGIAAGALEQSNVDISAEFIRMIAAQRAFEASSKIITTSDGLLAELMQMKR